MADEKPKIIVDDDWKAQAQAEKQKLAAEAKAKEAQAAQQQQGQQQIPPASFMTLVNSIAMQAIMAMGGVEDPQTKQRFVDLGLAKFHIDSLAVIKDKTKGNLEEEEDKLLERALHELQMNFVAMAQHAQKAAEQQGQAGGESKIEA